MEPTMINRKLSNSAAVLALVLAMAAPVASLAQTPPTRGAAASGAGVRAPGAVGAPAGRFVAGGGAPVGRIGGPVGGAPMPPARGFGGVPPQTHVGGGGGAWHGGGYDDHHRHGHGGFPGAIAGGIIGGVLASEGYGYYAPGYYDDQYYDDAAVAPSLEGDDAAAYCMQTYRSYDPQSGTYLGYDGLRHPCP
jgi:BA14K-like protein